MDERDPLELGVLAAEQVLSEAVKLVRERHEAYYRRHAEREQVARVREYDDLAAQVAELRRELRAVGGEVSSILHSVRLIEQRLDRIIPLLSSQERERAT